jgi:hypothetical protein
VTRVVEYRVGENTTAKFEIEPTEEWDEVSAASVLGQVKDAVAPAVASAQAVLDEVRAIGPDEIQVKFGIKVSGTMNWLVAKAATDANFEITLTWKPTDPGA